MSEHIIIERLKNMSGLSDEQIGTVLTKGSRRKAMRIRTGAQPLTYRDAIALSELFRVPTSIWADDPDKAVQTAIESGIFSLAEQGVPPSRWNTQLPEYELSMSA